MLIPTRTLIYCVTSLALTIASGGQLSAQTAGNDESADSVAVISEPSVTLLESTLVFDNPVPIINGLDPIFPTNAASTANDESDASLIEHTEHITASQELISALELRGGPWEQELTAQLQVLGSLYQQQGTYEQAIDAFERGMQVSRINSGLDSLDQVPLVESLVESHLFQENWAEADQYQNYLFYIQNKRYGASDPRMIPVLDSMARWNLQVFSNRYGESVGLRLTDAYSLFKAASAIVSVHFGNDDERYVAYLKDMAGSAYLVSRNQGLIEDAGRPEYRSAQAMFAERMNKIDPIHAQGYREGEEALTRVIEHFAAQDDAVVSHARALVDLGDWYMVFERRRAAEEQYQLAYGKLVTLEDGAERIAELLGQVVPLPAFSGAVGEIALQPAWQDSDLDSTSSGYADVSIDVNSFGQVSTVRVITEENEENARIMTMLRRHVRATTFRPVMENGVLVRSQDSRFRYRYRY